MERSRPDLTELGRRAQVFGLPTIDLYRILDSFALDPSSPEFKAPLGEFAHSHDADPFLHPHDQAEGRPTALILDVPGVVGFVDGPG